MDNTNPKQTHILYQLQDSGSHYRIANLVLYPGVPVPVEDVAEWFLKRLLEEKIAAYCDADGNLAPEDIRFGGVTDEDPFEDAGASDDAESEAEDEGNLSDLPDAGAGDALAPVKQKRNPRKFTEDKSPESTFGTS